MLARECGSLLSDSNPESAFAMFAEPAAAGLVDGFGSASK